MINNAQVNIWRGTEEPPTPYHVWIFENKKILINNGTEWIVLTDNIELVDKINDVLKELDKLKLSIDSINKYTVNNKLIKDNPNLDSDDIKSKANGNYVKLNDSVTDTVLNLDKVLTTQIVE